MTVLEKEVQSDELKQIRAWTIAWTRRNAKGAKWNQRQWWFFSQWSIQPGTFKLVESVRGRAEILRARKDAI